MEYLIVAVLILAAGGVGFYFGWRKGKAIMDEAKAQVAAAEKKVKDLETKIKK